MTRTACDNHHSQAVDNLFQLLASPHRREILFYLMTNDADTATLDELAAHLHEEGVESTGLQQAQITLIHNHLPGLVDYGTIEYDRRSETVRYRGDSTLEAVVHVAAAHD